jgi:hypothetical protein
MVSIWFWNEFAEAMRVLKLAVEWRCTRTFTATGKISKFYVCRFIDGTTSEH